MIAIVKYGFYSYPIDGMIPNKKTLYTSTHNTDQGLIPKIAHGIHFFLRESWFYEFTEI